tara:strand:- start:1996 stop:2466 length:471 start_codon:yes stop_codon:yes gene_type:complete
MYENMSVAIFISIALVLLTTSIFYEILGVVLRIIAKRNLRNRPLMFFLVVAIFSAHTVAVWIYGTVYWVMVHTFGAEPLSGIAHDNFFGYIYFSAATYSSLGIGDVFPHGAMQFITGVQVLNGLVLIGWSVMVTYFAVQKLWDVHLPTITLKEKNQ